MWASKTSNVCEPISISAAFPCRSTYISVDLVYPKSRIYIRIRCHRGAHLKNVIDMSNDAGITYPAHCLCSTCINHCSVVSVENLPKAQKAQMSYQQYHPPRSHPREYFEVKKMGQCSSSVCREKHILSEKYVWMVICQMPLPDSCEVGLTGNNMRREPVHTAKILDKDSRLLQIASSLHLID